jgi:hypothetical protein
MTCHSLPWREVPTAENSPLRMRPQYFSRITAIAACASCGPVTEIISAWSAA